MLTDFFEWHSVLRRLRAGCTGAHVDGFADALVEAGCRSIPVMRCGATIPKESFVVLMKVVKARRHQLEANREVSAPTALKT